MVLASMMAAVLIATAAPDVRAQYDIDHFFIRGQVDMTSGRYLQAITNYNIILRIDNTLYEAYFFRGIAKYNLGDFSGAEADFNKAIELNPVYTFAYHYRAITFSRTGRYDKAMEDLNHAVSLRPNYYGLYFSRGVTYFLSQQFEKAVEDFNRFIINEPDEPDAYLNRGASYLFLGDTLKALNDYDKAIQLDHTGQEGFIRRSRVYYAQHRYDEAIADLDHALELDSTNTFAYFNRGIMRYDLKDIPGALADLEKVLFYEPDNALTLYNHALILTQVGDYNRALEDYDRVLEINPENVLAYFNRSILFTEMGRYVDAYSDLSTAIDLYPDFAKAYMNRAYVQNLMGRNDEAEHDWNTAQEKITHYRQLTSDSAGRAAFADTSRRYDRLIALDSDFARSGFEDTRLRNRSVDIDLKPLYRIDIVQKNLEDGLPTLLAGRPRDQRLETFLASVPITTDLTCSPEADPDAHNALLREEVHREASATDNDRSWFAVALMDSEIKHFNSALSAYDKAIAGNPGEMFYYLNRGVLHAEMIEFISSIESNVQVLTIDNAGTARARVSDRTVRNYDYSAAIADMQSALRIYPDFPYTYYNLGNLYCLSGDMPEAIRQYTRALDLYSGLGEAYYNRGLILIYLKDKEKGCIDMSKAGELGLEEAYWVISRYCETPAP